MRILEILFLVLSAMLYNDCIVTCEREISAVDWAALSVSGLLSSLAAGQGVGDVGSGKPSPTSRPSVQCWYSYSFNIQLRGIR